VLATNGTAGETYNVASGIETPIGDVLTLVLQAAGLADTVRIVERYHRPADVPRAFADIRKLGRCGYAARYSLEQTVADVFAYYVSDVSHSVAGGRMTSATS
jgi:nucleoside-diphosphate-sugar epimerase